MFAAGSVFFTSRGAISMDLRMRKTSALNIWPAFTDVSIAMLLIFLFFLFIQFVFQQQIDPENPNGEKAGHDTGGI